MVLVTMVACGSFGSDATTPAIENEAGTEGGADDAGTGTETAPPVGCLTPQKLGNDETCLCNNEALGASQGCSLGKVGGTSKCKAGSQTCGPGTDGMKRWGPCIGATVPAAKETCFDDVDDDCDGILNNGCQCGDVALCKDPATGSDFTGDALILDKTTVKNGETLNAFFVSKKAIGTSWLSINPGGVCGGGGDTAPCPSSGCPGWNVERRKIDVSIGVTGLFRSGANTYTLKFRPGVNAVEQATCTAGPNTASATVNVTN